MINHPVEERDEVVSGNGPGKGELAEELLKNLSVVQVLSQVLDDNPLPDQYVVNPINEHLQDVKKSMLMRT